VLATATDVIGHGTGARVQTKATNSVFILSYGSEVLAQAMIGYLAVIRTLSKCAPGAVGVFTAICGGLADVGSTLVATAVVRLLDSIQRDDVTVNMVDVISAWEPSTAELKREWLEKLNALSSPAQAVRATVVA